MNLLSPEPGIADAARATLGRSFNSTIERHANNLERISGSELFFARTSSMPTAVRVAYNSFLRGVIDNINATDFSGIVNGSQVQSNAVWFVQQIIDWNNDPTGTRDAINLMMRR
jgi:hypothetical protein